MKVKKEQSAANRDALIQAAGPLFREKGIDGVGVAELCQAAGLTHGALYSHFGSKDALAAEALNAGHQASCQRMAKAVGGEPSLADLLDFYVSARHRDNLKHCCPLVAASSEAARQSTVYQESYAAAFGEIGESIRKAMPKRKDGTDQAVSMVIAASMIGIVAVARALRDVDRESSDTLLATARESMQSFARK